MARESSKIRIDYEDEGLAPPDDFTGLWEYYWPNMQLKFRANYIDGKEHGEVTCWWENGVVAQTGRRECGTCKGIWTDYKPDGTKSLETEYEDGDNFVKRWYSGGKVNEVEEFRDGIKFKKTEYLKGKKVIVSWVGEKPSLDSEEVVLRQEEWQNGAKVKEVEYQDKRNFVVRWYSKGEVERVDEWRDGQIVGGGE